MANNINTLIKARKAKNDEFYTQLTDIEKELAHYKEHFKGKTVLCNCDDPRVSNFFKYFAYNFEKLGLKKLITTCYKNQNPNLFTRYDSDKAVFLEYTGDKDGNRCPDQNEIEVIELEGDGDFRSEECIKLLKQADIVCTNPPFSLFREYVDQLIEYKKDFLIIGTMNAITYKNIFTYIRDEKLWLGFNSVKEFITINNEIQKFGNVVWFTNLSTTKRNEEIILYKKYNTKEYPKYDDFNAIEVGKVKDIPIDYKGIMGVPISFLNNHNPKQFEIVGMIAPGKNNKNYLCEPLINGVYKYRRLAIIKKGN